MGELIGYRTEAAAVGDVYPVPPGFLFEPGSLPFCVLALPNDDLPQSVLSRKRSVMKGQSLLVTHGFNQAVMGAEAVAKGDRLLDKTRLQHVEGTAV